MKPQVIFILLALGFWSCDESLPPRNDPAVVLQTSFLVNHPDILVMRDSLPAAGDMTGGFRASVENVYTEVLQDTEQVRLDVEVWLKDQPAARATIHATANDLVNIRMVQWNLLTIGIDSAAVVLKQWSHHTDAGIPFWNYASGMTPGYTKSGEKYCQTTPLKFAGRAKIQVFKRVQPVVVPAFEFQLVYQVFDIACPN
jgi:hypothetical protein